ncbi:MAG: DUF89 family protein [Euryarchaeota archaeon]|nr:DUF89 family protein [Euryarchaeota archaeon]
MKVRAQCAPCLLNRVLYETRLVNPELEGEVIEACLKKMCELWAPNETSTEIAVKVHRLAYDMLGTDDPYAMVKAVSNRVAIDLLPRARAKAVRSKDRLREAALAAIIGNVLDFGIRSAVDEPEQLRGKFDALWAEGLHRDDTKKMAKYLRNGARIVYLADNCGEIIFDTILLDELRRRGAHVTLVVRGKKILTDATMEDVKALGIGKHADAIATTESFAVGLPTKPMPRKLRKLLEGADLIICKGMGNYEALSEQGFRPIIYLMRTKCRPVAESVGEPLDKNVAKMFE